MREFLFKGKQKYSGKWVYGSFFSPNAIMKRGKGFDDDKTYTILPETVGQYTGLTDKNGTKIFEGDILRIRRLISSKGDYPPLPYPVNVVVKWDFCAWMWETLCDDKRYLSFPEALRHYDCEVIGNIHDNPEALNVGDNNDRA